MMKTFITLLIICTCLNAFGQEKTDTQQKMKKQSKVYTYEGNQSFEKEKHIAESHYRKAIAKDKENIIAPYNMGDLLYKQNLHQEAGYFFKEASLKKEASKEQKHKAFHNMGNVFMQTKQYDKAVMAYKEALRNNPNDDQTRYNFALAKEFLKNNPPKQDQQKEEKPEDKKQQENQQKEEKSEDKKQQENQQEGKKTQDKKQQENQQKEEKSEDKKQQENQQEGKKSQDKKQQENQQKEEKSEDKKQQENQQKGKKTQDKKQQENQQKEEKSEDKKQQENQQKEEKSEDNDPNQPQDPNEKNSQSPENQPQKEELSLEQAERILEAINKEEKKTQEKINAQKIKGKPVGSGKDW